MFVPSPPDKSNREFIASILVVVILVVVVLLLFGALLALTWLGLFSDLASSVS